MFFEIPCPQGEGSKKTERNIQLNKLTEPFTCPAFYKELPLTGCLKLAALIAESASTAMIALKGNYNCAATNSSTRANSTLTNATNTKDQ